MPYLEDSLDSHSDFESFSSDVEMSSVTPSVANTSPSPIPSWKPFLDSEQSRVWCFERNIAIHTVSKSPFPAYITSDHSMSRIGSRPMMSTSTSRKNFS